MEPSLDNALEAALLNRQDGASIYLAYSGGLDSQVLLHLVAAYTQKYALRLVALHVNYGFSSNADDWQAFCEAQCDKIDVRLKVAKYSSEEKGHSEQQARAFRYQWFESKMTPAAILLTAHHQDDQAETVLMRLARASGARGMAAIPKERDFADGKLIRPLLGFSKASLRSYAEQHAIKWIEDESNNDENFDRNYMRKTVLPVMAKRWPQIGRQLAQVAQNSADDYHLKKTLAAIDVESLSKDDRCSVMDLAPPIALQAFCEFSVARQRNIIQYLVSDFIQYPIARTRLNEWLEQVQNHGEGQNTRLNLDTLSLVLHAQKIHILRRQSAWRKQTIDWTPDKPLEIEPLGCELYMLTGETGGAASQAHLNLEPAEALCVHWRQGGERVRREGEPFSRSLKQLFQENKVAPWLRDSLPLISCRGEIIWSAALGAFAPSLLDSNNRALNFTLKKST